MNIAYQRALILHQLARYTDAEHELRHALAVDPADAQAHAMLALCLTQQGKFKAARDSAEAAIAKEPTLAFAHYAVAVTLLRDDHFESARETEVGSEVALGRSYRLQLAEQNIRAAIRFDPENANYHALLGNVLLERGDGQEAVDAARLALAFEPGRADAMKIIVVAAGYLGAAERELSSSVGAITTTPDGAIEKALFGAALLRAGHPIRAVAHLEAALRLDPDHPYIRRQFLEGARSRSKIHALGLRTRHDSAVVANPYAAFYSVALMLLIGAGFVAAMFLSQKIGLTDSRELILLAGFMLPAYALITLRGWIDFRLQFDASAGRLLSNSERRQANAAVWGGATLLAAQAIPLGVAIGHGDAGIWIFAGLELALTIVLIAIGRAAIRLGQ